MGQQNEDALARLCDRQRDKIKELELQLATAKSNLTDMTRAGVELSSLIESKRKDYQESQDHIDGLEWRMLKLQAKLDEALKLCFEAGKAVGKAQVVVQAARDIHNRYKSDEGMTKGPWVEIAYLDIAFKTYDAEEPKTVESPRLTRKVCCTDLPGTLHHKTPPKEPKP